MFYNIVQDTFFLFNVDYLWVADADIVSHSTFMSDPFQSKAWCCTVSGRERRTNGQDLPNREQQGKSKAVGVTENSCTILDATL